MATKPAKPKTTRKPRRVKATFVFLNCNHLDYLANKQLPMQKINDLAATFRAAAGNKPPSLIGLCEVHDIVLAKALVEEVAPNTYGVVMSTAPTDPMSAMGLALCYDLNLFSIVDVVRDRPRRPLTSSRSFWLATQLQFQKRSKASLWIILNHWKSWLQGELATELARIENFREMEELFRTTSDLRGQSVGSAVKPLIEADDYVLVAGDFNCEPGSRPLCFPTRAEGVEVRRHLGGVVGATRNRTLFLNTMWSVIGSDDPNRPSFFHGTYTSGNDNSGPRMFDQILVSRALLEPDAHLQYVAGSTRIQAPQGMASDHSAVAASLTY